MRTKLKMLWVKQKVTLLRQYLELQVIEWFFSTIISKSVCVHWYIATLNSARIGIANWIRSWKANRFVYLLLWKRNWTFALRFYEKFGVVSNQDICWTWFQKEDCKNWKHSARSIYNVKVLNFLFYHYLEHKYLIKNAKNYYL